jgi:hypothetical protein
MRRSEWLIGGASVRGSAHVRNDRPNQDAIAWLPGSGRGGRIVGAVSDGHGAPLHFRSDVGSRLAVDRAADVVAWHLDEDEADEAEGALAGEILDAWRSAVDDHLADNPPPPGTTAGMLSYGATLIALGATSSLLTMMQIGDGDLLLGFADGRLERPLRADSGLVGEETYSLCQADAQIRFRVATMWRGEGEWPDFALLATDGVSKSFRDEASFLAAAARFHKLAADDWQGTLDALPDWLAEVSAKGSGDDSSLCLARRIDAGNEPRGDQP